MLLDIGQLCFVGEGGCISKKSCPDSKNSGSLSSRVVFSDRGAIFQSQPPNLILTLLRARLLRMQQGI